MPQIKRPIPENHVYSRILFWINDKEITSMQLAKMLKKDQSSLLRQMRHLEKNGYLSVKEENKKFNEKLFSINWHKIEEEFYNFTLNLGNEKILKEILIKDKYKNIVAEVFKKDRFIDMIINCFIRFQENNINLNRIFLSIVNFFGNMPPRFDDKLARDITNHKFIYSMTLIHNMNATDTPEWFIYGWLDSIKKKSDEQK
jgi:hypothetical protein